MILLASFIASSQECIAKNSEIDELTEELIEEWGGKLGGRSSGTEAHKTDLYLTKEENKLAIIFYITSQTPKNNSSIFNPTFLEGENFIIKTDGGLLEFRIEKVEKSNKNSIRNYFVFNKLIASISKDEVAKLANETIEFYRSSMENHEKVEGKVSKKDAERLQEQFSCFLQKLK